MIHTTTFHVTDANDEVHAYLGGPANTIPLIAFGPGNDATILVNSTLLTPAEQASWLMRLAAAAMSLATQVEDAAMAGAES